MSNSIATATLPDTPGARTRPELASLGIPLAVIVAGFAWLFRHVIVKLVHDWATDDNYSHGFLIVPIALYLVWERRERLFAIERRPQAIGLAVVLGSAMVLAAGTLGAELFLMRISML